MLNNSQAGPGRTVKQKQEDISRNHVQTFIFPSVHAYRADRKKLGNPLPRLHQDSRYSGSTFFGLLCWSGELRRGGRGGVGARARSRARCLASLFASFRLSPTSSVHHSEIKKRTREDESCLSHQEKKKMPRKRRVSLGTALASPLLYNGRPALALAGRARPPRLI